MATITTNIHIAGRLRLLAKNVADGVNGTHWFEIYDDGGGNSNAPGIFVRGISAARMQAAVRAFNDALWFEDPDPDEEPK